MKPLNIVIALVCGLSIAAFAFVPASAAKVDAAATADGCQYGDTCAAVCGDSCKCAASKDACAGGCNGSCDGGCAGCTCAKAASAVTADSCPCGDACKCGESCACGTAKKACSDECKGKCDGACPGCSCKA